MFTLWKVYQGVKCWRHDNTSAYIYQTSNINLDADGSPNAYGPGKLGLDYAANAGYPNKGWRACLVSNPDDPGSPYIQTDGPFKGYYVSMTSLFDETGPATNPSTYVDATQIPYIVIPGSFYRQDGTGQLGDFVMVKNITNGKTSPAIIADVGPSTEKLGEMSLALATALGGQNPNPKNGLGIPNGMIRYMVFPNSRLEKKWPLPLETIDLEASNLLEASGGWDLFDSVLA